MGRIRSIHPDLCVSESMAELSAELERTFTRLWIYLDDQGRGEDSVRLIKAAIYPQHDSQTLQVIEAELTKLAQLCKVIRWEEDGKRLIAVKPESWDAYQHPQKPRKSKYATPPGYVEVDYRPGRESESHSSGAIRYCADMSTGLVQEGSGPVVVDVGVVVDVVKTSDAVASKPSKPTDDPVKAQAHKLATLAMEQPIKPDIARTRGGPFPAVMSLFERRLRAGVPASILREVILAGVEVWTIAGLQTAEAHLKSSRHSGRDPNDTQRRIEERREHRKAREQPQIGET